MIASLFVVVVLHVKLPLIILPFVTHALLLVIALVILRFVVKALFAVFVFIIVLALLIVLTPLVVLALSMPSGIHGFLVVVTVVGILAPFAVRHPSYC